MAETGDTPDTAAFTPPPGGMDVLTAGEFAASLRVSPATAYRAIARGVPSVRVLNAVRVSGAFTRALKLALDSGPVDLIEFAHIWEQNRAAS